MFVHLLLVLPLAFCSIQFNSLENFVKANGILIGYTLSGNYSDPDAVLSYGAKGKTTGYIGFGQVKVRQMAGSKNIMIGFSNGTAQERDLNMESKAGVVLSETPLNGEILTGTEDGSIWVSGSRKMSTFSSFGEPNMTFIYAFHSKPLLEYHDGDRGFAVVDFRASCPKSCSLRGTCKYFPLESLSVCECSSGYAGTICELCSSGFVKDGDNCVPEGEQVKTNFIKLGGGKSEGGIDMGWELSKTEVTFTLTAETLGYIAIGFGTTSMISKDTVIAWAQGNGRNWLRDYEVNKKSVSGITLAGSQPSTLISATESNGITTIVFKRPLEPGGDMPAIIPGKETSFIWAVGPNDAIEEHNAKGSFKLDLSSSSVTEVPEPTAKRTSHGVLMFLSWAVLVTAGISSARYGRHLGPVWFQGHRGLMASGISLGIIGLAIAISMVRSAHFTSLHSIIGLLVTLLSLVQPLNALFRPAPTDKNRWIFNLAHRSTGILAYIMSITNIFIGLKMFGVSAAIWVLVSLYYVFVSVGFGFAEFKLLPKRPVIGATIVADDNKTPATNNNNNHDNTVMTSAEEGNKV